ncbi:MAG: outer membrane protein assembly factor BamD [Bacteroidota bacterium]
MRNIPLKYVITLVLALSLVSCSKYDKLLKSTDYPKKYEVAMKYYGEKDYFRALQLFDDLYVYYRGTERLKDVMYYLAYCYYNKEDYIMASYYFKEFTKVYPTEPRAEESAFRNAYCYYLDSPDYELDQSNTLHAINEMQLFLNNYPQSTRVEECNKVVDQLRAKLELKSYENAKLYYKMEEYAAAAIAFTNLIKDYPDTKNREEAMFLILKSQYIYARKSVAIKKAVRFRAAMESYRAFILKYPESKNRRDADAISEQIVREMKLINAEI